jgi:hypothetical protein
LPDGTLAKDLPTLDRFTDTAFKTEEKSESGLITSKGGVYYIVHVDSVTPERKRTLDEVRGEVTGLWQKVEQSKHLAMVSQEIAKGLQSQDTRAATISKYNLHGEPVTIKHSSHNAGDIQLSPDLVSDVFSLKTGGATGPHMLKDNDYMVAVLTTVTPFSAAEKTPELAKERDEVRSTLQGNMQNEIVEEYTRHLAKKYSVSINESMLKSLAP